jgi:glycosyltransferase involved in cell wall biosynthesis
MPKSLSSIRRESQVALDREEMNKALTKKRILVDLKPAFDGFAGIPQETRLLFRGLRQEGQWDVRGLIQHGARTLRAGVQGGQTRQEASRRIFQMSELIVSSNQRKYSGLFDAAGVHFKRYISLEMLRAKVLLGIKVPKTTFDARLFPDFIWRTFFDKTLNAADKDCLVADEYYVLQPSRKDFQNVGLRSALLSSKPRFPMINSAGFDFFVSQTPFPGRLSDGTQLIVRYHDAVPLLMPHTIKDKAYHQATHYQALRSNIASGAKFACVSEASRQDLLTVFPQVEKDAFVVHNMVSEEYFEDESPRTLVPSLVRNRLAEVNAFVQSTSDSKVADDFQYLLMVSTLEPRKNHLLLVSAWERLKYTTHPNLKLIVVGNIGWDEDAVLKAFKPWVLKGDLYYLQNVPSAELRVLYKHAAATVCPSLAEGFDYSGVEAMRCGSPVVSSDIPVHREIYGQASAYFDPYSIEGAAMSLTSVLKELGRRESMIQLGRKVSERYLPSCILPAWTNFFAATR